MRILVVGDGKVGHTLAEHLAREGHDVVIVDRSDEVLQRSEDTLDVLCVRGNGANAKTLIDAGVDKAVFLFATTACVVTIMLCCLLGTELTGQERLFCILAYLPKATVQAAIGSVPLSLELPCGRLVLSVAVLAILITAPLGAIGIDASYRKLLQKQE